MVLGLQAIALGVAAWLLAAPGGADAARKIRRRRDRDDPSAARAQARNSSKAASVADVSASAAELAETREQAASSSRQPSRPRARHHYLQRGHQQPRLETNESAAPVPLATPAPRSEEAGQEEEEGWLTWTNFRAMVHRMNHTDLRPMCSEGFEATTGLGCKTGCQCRWFMKCRTKYIVWPEGAGGGDPGEEASVTNVGACGWAPEVLVFATAGGFCVLTFSLLLCFSFSKATGPKMKMKLKPKIPKKQLSAETF